LPGRECGRAWLREGRFRAVNFVAAGLLGSLRLAVGS